MLFGKKKNLQEEIVEILLERDILTGKEIHTHLEEQGEHYSIQAVHQQLRNLLNEHVLNKDKTRYKIHNEWKQRLLEKTSKFNLFSLPEEGEKVRYRFNSPIHLEIFDKDITYGIYSKLPSATLFVYTYHYIWPLLRKRIESYKTFHQIHEKKKRYAFYNVASADPLDLLVKKKIENNFYRITKNENLSYIEKNNLTMIIGPYLIQSTFDEEKMEEVDRIYKSKLPLAEQIERIQDFFSEDQKCTTTIENNPKRAHRIKKAIAKNFLLPDQVKEELEEEAYLLKR